MEFNYCELIKINYLVNEVIINGQGLMIIFGFKIYFILFNLVFLINNDLMRYINSF